MIRAAALLALCAFAVWCWVRGFYAAGKPTAETFFAGFFFAAVACALLVISLAGCDNLLVPPDASPSPSPAPTATPHHWLCNYEWETVCVRISPVPTVTP